MWTILQLYKGYPHILLTERWKCIYDDLSCSSLSRPPSSTSFNIRPKQNPTHIDYILFHIRPSKQVSTSVQVVTNKAHWQGSANFENVSLIFYETDKFHRTLQYLNIRAENKKVEIMRQLSVRKIKSTSIRFLEKPLLFMHH